MSRDAIVFHLDKINDYEEKRAAVHQTVNGIRSFSMNDTLKVKEHIDVEFVYYWTAVNALGRGEIEKYDELIDLAGQELRELVKVVIPYLRESAFTH